MIKAINLPQLRNSEFLQFANDIINRCELVNQEGLKLIEVVTALKGTTTELEKVYNKDTHSDVTEKLIASDANRDSDLVGIHTVCEGYIYSRDADKVASAKRVLQSIDRYGKSISRLNYQAETTVVDAIISDWKADKQLTQDLNKLHLTDWVSLFGIENDTFGHLYQARVDDKLDSVGDSFTELRSGVIIAYRTLCDTIFAYSVINKNEHYQKLADAINLIISDYQAILDRRTTSNIEE